MQKKNDQDIHLLNSIQLPICVHHMNLKSENIVIWPGTDQIPAVRAQNLSEFLFYGDLCRKLLPNVVYIDETRGGNSQEALVEIAIKYY